MYVGLGMVIVIRHGRYASSTVQALEGWMGTDIGKNDMRNLLAVSLVGAAMNHTMRIMDSIKHQ